MNKFKDKVVLITGASSGIGKELANQMSIEGSKVIGVGSRSKKNVQDLEELVDYRDIDLQNLLQIEELVRSIKTKIDFVFINAAVGKFKPIQEQSISEINSQIDINLKAPIMLTMNLIARSCIQKGGHIIFTSSLSGIVGMENLSVYCATKFGIEGFARSIRKEHPEYQVTILKPGITITEFFDKANMIEFKKFVLKNPHVANTTNKVAKRLLNNINRNDVVVGGDRLYLALSKYVPEKLKPILLTVSSYFNRFL
jgi:uncharacterized protein